MARRSRSAAHAAVCSDGEFDSCDSDIEGEGDRGADSEMDVSDDDVEGIADGYGTTQPIHTLPPELFADSSGFTETVRAVDKEKLEAMNYAVTNNVRYHSGCLHIHRAGLVAVLHTYPQCAHWQVTYSTAPPIYDVPKCRLGM